MATLEDVIALNDEVAMMAEAGIPLTSELTIIGRNRKQELTRIHAAVARRVGRGEPLVDAVAVEDDALPVGYQKLVEAGLRSGRLPAALERLCDASQTTRSLKAAISTALIYPALITTLAFGLLLASLTYYIPTLLDAYRELEVPLGFAMRVCFGLRRSLPIWGPVVIGLWLLTLIAWVRIEFRPTLRWRWLQWLPIMRQMLDDVDCSSVVKLTALLTESKIPALHSFRLAAGAVGNRRFQRAANQLEQRDSQTTGDIDSIDLPPMLRWWLQQTRRDDSASKQHVSLLHLLGNFYHHRAEAQVRRIRRWIPLCTLVMIGGGATLLYLLSVFVPFIELLRGVI